MQKAVLDILAVSLYSRPIPERKGINWQAVLEEAIEQGIFSMIFDPVESVLKTEVSVDEYDHFKRIHRTSVAIEMNNLYQHKQISTELSKNRIAHVMIKGQVSASYYINPYLRLPGDIDCIVEKKDLKSVEEIFKTKGYSCSGKGEHPVHITFAKESEIVEIHWEPGGIPQGKKGQICREYLSDILETAQFYEDMIVPDDFHHGIILLLHSAVHMLNTGIGLRHLCDWAAYIAKVKVSDFESDFQRMGLWRFAQVLTQVCVKYLQCPGQLWAMEDVDDALLEKLIEDIFESGEFGYKDRERINEAKLMTTIAQGNVGDIAGRQLIRMLTEKAERALPMSRKIPIILPVVWIYVSLRHLYYIIKNKRPPIHVKKMVAGANRRREIYKRFELFE